MSHRGHQSGDYGSRLTRAEAQIAELRKGQEVIFSKLDDTSSKIDNIASSLHELRGAAGPSLPVLVDMGVKVAGLFAAIVAGILYLASGSNTAELRELDKRIARIETVLSLATVRRVPSAPSAWVPGTAHWR